MYKILYLYNATTLKMLKNELYDFLVIPNNIT